MAWILVLGTLPQVTISQAFSLNNKTINPNPTSSNVTIDYESQGNGELYVYDITGKEVLRQEINTGNNTVVTDELEGGVYFYRVGNKEGIVGVGKLVVVRDKW